MAVPKRKMSKMKRRQRQAANAYEGVQANFCPQCGEPAAPHAVCKHCGTYKGKQLERWTGDYNYPLSEDEFLAAENAKSFKSMRILP